MTKIYNEVKNNEQKVIPDKRWSLDEIMVSLGNYKSIAVYEVSEEQGIGDEDEEKLSSVGDSPFVSYWRVFIVLWTSRVHDFTLFVSLKDYSHCQMKADLDGVQN